MTLIKTFLLFIFIFRFAPGYAQINKKKAENSFTTTFTDTVRHKKEVRKNWHPYAGLHLSGDAGMYYIGPSYQAGVDYNLKKKLILSLYFHYFGDKLQSSGTNGFFEKGKYRTFTSALLLQVNTSKKTNDRSFFMGAGATLQYRKDTALTSYDSWNDTRTTFTPAFRLGYFFPVGKHKLTIELNGTGPYTYSETDFSVLEILTQLSLGCRYIF